MFQKALNFENTQYIVQKGDRRKKKMKSRNIYLTAIIASMMLLMTFAPIKLANAQVRTGDLRIHYYSSPEVAYGNLEAGVIDLMFWPLSAEQYAAAIENPDIVLAPVVENGMMEFDLNSNETIATYPGVNSPMSYFEFRAALALLTDKPYIVEGICGGFAARMDVPIVKSAPTWINTSVVYPNYPWEYDPAAAADLLDSAGFLQGATSNPDYDPEFPGSAEYMRTYPDYAIVHDSPHVSVDVTGPSYVWTLMLPAIEVRKVMGVPVDGYYYTDLAYTFDANTITVDVELTECTYIWIEYAIEHPKAGQNLDNIIFYARSDHLPRLNMGIHLRDNMAKMGIPVTFNALPAGGCYPPVMADRDYHIYTGGWRLGRFPTSMFFLYNSFWWFPWGPNYCNPPIPRPGPGPSVIDPNLDIYLRDIYYAPDIPTAMKNAKLAQGLHVLKVVNIPTHCAKSYFAWRNWLLGVVNMDAYGPENGYTFMNAYKASGAPEQGVIRVGTNQPPTSHNILFSSWVYDYSQLDRYWEGGQAVNPYDIVRDQPWIVQDWGVGSWVDPDDGLTKTKVTFWLRQDVSWAAPVTGDYIRPFTAHDVMFSDMFYFFFDDGWNWDNVMDIDHINIIDDYCYEIYFVDESYWLQYSSNYPYLPKNEWGELFCTPATYSEPGAIYAAGESLYLLGDGVAQVESITVGGEVFTDYWVRFNSTGVYSANRIYFTAPVSGDLVINYLNITGDPHGYFPGSDTEWIPSSYSCGQYIPVDITKDTWAVFKRNDYFFLETPPLGEVDWYWWWGDRDANRPAPDFPDGPRTGCFIVDIYDVTFACMSYGSTGYLEPTTIPPWTPGADLAPSNTATVPYGGEVDIYDVSSILISYGTEFGHPPTETG